jgi:hypothetical protein
LNSLTRVILLAESPDDPTDGVGLTLLSCPDDAAAAAVIVDLLNYSPRLEGHKFARVVDVQDVEAFLAFAGIVIGADA